MILRAVSLLLKMWFMTMRSLPLYFQSKLHNDEEVIRDIDEAYSLLFSGAIKTLYGLSLMLIVPAILVLMIAAVFLPVATLAHLLGQLFATIVALVVAVNLVSIGIAVLVFIFRELRNAAISRLAGWSVASDADGKDRSSKPTISRSKSETKIRPSKSRRPSRSSNPSKPEKSVSMPTGDYHRIGDTKYAEMEVETDDMGQLRE